MFRFQKQLASLGAKSVTVMFNSHVMVYFIFALFVKPFVTWVMICAIQIILLLLILFIRMWPVE